MKLRTVPVGLGQRPCVGLRLIGRSRRLRRETGSGVEPNHLDATRDEESEDEEKVLRHSKLEL